MPRVNLTVAMLVSMHSEFVGSNPETVLELEEATGTDAYGIIVRYLPHGSVGPPHKILVTDFGAVRIA